MESQILIVAQASAKEINFFAAALALGYAFNENHCVKGGFGANFEGLTKNVGDVRKNSEIFKIVKKELEGMLRETILRTLGISDNEVVACFSATPRTFGHYFNGTQLGGNAMSVKNFLPFLPGNDTPTKNLYNVGDTVYAAQGWPGVALGV